MGNKYGQYKVSRDADTRLRLRPTLEGTTTIVFAIKHRNGEIGQRGELEINRESAVGSCLFRAVQVGNSVGTQLRGGAQGVGVEIGQLSVRIDSGRKVGNRTEPTG